MSKVVCTSLNSESGPHFEVFRAAGFDVSVAPRDVSLFAGENLAKVLQGATAVVAGSEPYPPAVIDALPELRVIARTGVGFDAVDLPACDRRGVVVTTTPGVNHHSVAEHTFALLFGVARGFPVADQQVRAGKWKRVAWPRVMGSTIGIVGLGRIGQAVCTRAIGLGMHVVAYEPYPNAEFVKQWNVELVDFDRLLARSDYVTLHLPMSVETKHLMNRTTFAKMKPESVLINTARGQLVDEAALVESIRAGHLRGAGLDVFQVEPLPLDSPLLTCEGILLSGHLAGLDRESHADTFRMAAETIVALRDGRWPAECIQNLRGVAGWKWARS